MLFYERFITFLDFLCRNYDSLDESSVEANIRLAFDVAEREFGISPLMTVDETLSVGEPDSLSMVMYLSQFYQLLREPSPPAGETPSKPLLIISTVCPFEYI